MGCESLTTIFDEVNMKKSLIITIICTFLAFCLISCDDDKDKTNDNGTQTSTTPGNPSNPTDNPSNPTDNPSNPTDNPPTETTTVKIGDSCNPASFSEVCIDGEGYECDDTTKKVVSLECKKDNLNCVVFKDGHSKGVDMANCMNDKAKCSKENDTQGICIEFQESGSNSISMQGNMICTKASDDQLYWKTDMDSFEDCSEQCNKEQTACEVMSEETDKPCKTEGNTDSDYCDENGNTMICSGEKYIIRYCSKLKEDGYSCLTFKDFYSEGVNAVACLTQKSECKTEQQKQTFCEEDDEYSYTYTAICTKATDGKNYWLTDPNELDDECEDGCNKAGTACK